MDGVHYTRDTRRLCYVKIPSLVRRFRRPTNIQITRKRAAAATTD